MLRDIIILHKCTINNNHIMHGSSDMKWDTQSYLSFWTILTVKCCPLYFDAKHLENGQWHFWSIFFKKVNFFHQKVPFLANIECCPKFLEYAMHCEYTETREIRENLENWNTEKTQKTEQTEETEQTYKTETEKTKKTSPSVKILESFVVMQNT